MFSGVDNFFTFEDVKFIFYQILCGYLSVYLDSNTFTLLTLFTETSSLPMYSSTLMEYKSKFVISVLPGLSKTLFFKNKPRTVSSQSSQNHKFLRKMKRNKTLKRKSRHSRKSKKRIKKQLLRIRMKKSEKNLY